MKDTLLKTAGAGAAVYVGSQLWGPFKRLFALFMILVLIYIPVNWVYHGITGENLIKEPVTNPWITQLKQASDDTNSKKFISTYQTVCGDIRVSIDAGLIDKVIRDTAELIAILKASPIDVPNEEQSIRVFEESITVLKRAKNKHL